jgi:hypothetical protein
MKFVVLNYTVRIPGVLSIEIERTQFLQVMVVQGEIESNIFFDVNWIRAFGKDAESLLQSPDE